MNVDELQGLLLQISFAIMIVFIMAYFLFRSDSRKIQESQLLELERQKLAIAAETTDAETRQRFGLDILDSLDYSSNDNLFIDGASITGDNIISNAFSKLGNASPELEATLALRRLWMNRVCELAQLDLKSLSPASIDWLSRETDAAISRYENSASRVRFRAATELQRHWMADPASLDDPVVERILAEIDTASEERRLLLVTDLAAALKSRALAHLTTLLQTHSAQ